MKKRFGPSLYFANDKVIFDALNQRQVNTDLIRELLNERGILVSQSTPRDELAQHFSRLTADYFDHESIAEKLGRVSRRERITSFEVTSKLEQEQVVQSLQSIKNELQEQGDNVNVFVKDDGKIIAEISYEHIDYTKSEFKQVQRRDAVIEFTKEPSGKYVVRSTQNQFTEAVVTRVCSNLEKAIGTPLDKSRISLEGHPDPKDRTKFFEALIKDITGYKFVTVTEAFCFKPKSNPSIEEGAEEKELEDQPFVERVSLRGQGVNRSFVIDDLFDNGYYVIKVIWQVKSEASFDSDIFELEAQFSEPDSCTGFSYQAKSVLICEAGKVTDKRRSPKSDEQNTLFKLVEEAAKRAYSTL